MPEKFYFLIIKESQQLVAASHWSSDIFGAFLFFLWALPVPPGAFKAATRKLCGCADDTHEFRPADESVSVPKISGVLMDSLSEGVPH